MNHIVELLKIIEAGLKLDNVKVKNYSNLLADKLEAEGEDKLSVKIKNLLSSSQTSLIEKSSITKTNKSPVDQESRLPMVEINYPDEFHEMVFLNMKAEKKIENFFQIYHHSDQIVSKGLNIPASLLLYGPPGNGKTLLANYIGHKIGLPVVVARLDSMISSFLGSTAKNIRTIFEYANKTPCVLFLDEFDAIAKLRDDKNELGELKRVVNSLLQNIDSLDQNSILIAATNHEKLLDPAVWRRFYYKVELEHPDFETRKKMIEYFSKPYEGLSDEHIENFSYLFDNISGAGIANIIKRAKISSIINGDTSTISTGTITNSYFDFITMEPEFSHSNILEVDSIREKICFIRKINPRIFSYRRISELLGISKSLVQKHLNSIEGELENG